MSSSYEQVLSELCRGPGPAATFHGGVGGPMDRRDGGWELSPSPPISRSMGSGTPMGNRSALHSSIAVSTSRKNVAPGSSTEGLVPAAPVPEGLAVAIPDCAASQLQLYLREVGGDNKGPPLETGPQGHTGGNLEAQV